MAQQPSESGYVIGIEDNKIYVDFGNGTVAPGMQLTVISGGGYFVHPVTKERIARVAEPIAEIMIEKVFDSYSVATAVPAQALKDIAIGMQVRIPSNVSTDPFQNQAMTSTPTDMDPESDRVSVVVAPAQVNDIVGIGYFGTYVSDILMEQLMLCDRVRLLDRTILGAQLEEINLTGAYIDPNTAIQQGKIAGAQYIIQVTMQKPDVVNIRTGIPLAAVMGAVQAATGTNIGAQYASNMQVAQLKAAVSLSARVIDLQTGEVVFMSSGTGKAQGKSQLSMEYGALSGAELNGGADGFKQTVTGQAIQKAFVPIGRNLNKFFNGETTERVMGSTSGYGNYGDELTRRGSKLYMGTEQLKMDDVKMLFADNSQRFFQYRSAKKMNGWGTSLSIIGGISFISGIVGYSINGSSLWSNNFFYFIGGGAAIATGGVILKVTSRDKIKKLVNEYNRENQRLASSWNVVSDRNGIGLRLTF